MSSKINNYLYVDKRYLSHEGTIVDIGCLYWYWSCQFAGQKPIVGIDPEEQNCPEWATLIKKAVSISNGKIQMGVNGTYGNSIVFDSKDSKLVECISLKYVIDNYSPISILKMNIEGAEYPLILSVKHPIADQLVISFHDDSWTIENLYPKELTHMLIKYLSIWYNPIEISQSLGWFLFLKK